MNSDMCTDSTVVKEPVFTEITMNTDTHTASTDETISTAYYTQTTASSFAPTSSFVASAFPERYQHTQNINKEDDVEMFDIPLISDIFPKKFKEKIKVLSKSQTYKKPIKKQFTSMFAVIVGRKRDYSRN